MNETKQASQPGQGCQYASWFKALADATRIEIVSLLARRASPMNVGEIVAAVHVGQSTVSAHLKVLAEVGFVSPSTGAPRATTGSTTPAWTASRPPPTLSWDAQPLPSQPPSGS